MFKWDKNYRKPLVDLPIKIDNLEDYKIIFNAFNNTKPKLKFGDYEYQLYHEGLNDNKAYFAKSQFRGKKLMIELIKDGEGKWAFHVENKGQMILDSRLGNMYFNTAFECHKKCLSSIYEHLNRTNL